MNENTGVGSGNYDHAPFLGSREFSKSNVFKKIADRIIEIDPKILEFDDPAACLKYINEKYGKDGESEFYKLLNLDTLFKNYTGWGSFKYGYNIKDGFIGCFGDLKAAINTELHKPRINNKYKTTEQNLIDTIFPE